jgi:hypothetical protein
MRGHQRDDCEEPAARTRGPASSRKPGLRNSVPPSGVSIDVSPASTPIRPRIGASTVVRPLSSSPMSCPLDRTVATVVEPTASDLTSSVPARPSVKLKCTTRSNSTSRPGWGASAPISISASTLNLPSSSVAVFWDGSLRF